MKRYRPTSVLVLAVLHLIGGTLGLAADLFTLAMQTLTFDNQKVLFSGNNPQGPVNAQNFGAGLAQYVQEHVPHYLEITLAQLALSIFLDVLLLIGGVGLLKVRAYGRNVSLAYAVLSFLNRLFAIVYGLAVVLPVTDEYLDRVARQNPNMAAAVTGGRIGGLVGLLASFVFILYPIAVLIVLLLPRVAAAFRGAGAAPVVAEPADYLDADRPFRADEPPPDAITR